MAVKAGNGAMKWRIGDIVDLEYFLHADAGSQPPAQQEEIHARDRKIFLEAVLPNVGEGESPDRRTMIRTWLDRRRETARTGVPLLPGETVEGLSGALRFWFPGAGLAAGAVAGVSFLAYTGDSPVNVFVYLSLFVFSQVLMLLALLVLTVYRLAGRGFPSSSPLYKLIGRLFLRMVLSARGRLEGKLPADRRLHLEKAIGAVTGKTRTYGLLFFLPVWILTQLFAVGFNLGLLAATLFKVVTSDIAFGWQSTIQLGPKAVHALARAIAVPWSWAISGDAAFPSLEQIEGSRIILKEGIYHLSTPDLVSWWPFLCLAVLVYGLLPRLLLFLGAVALQRRFLGSLDFRQAACEQLLQRMSTPLVTTRGRQVEEPAETGGRPRPAGPEEQRVDLEGASRKSLVVMIPDDISDVCSREEIEAVLNRGGGYAIRDIIRFGLDQEADRELLARLREGGLPADGEILLIYEAWQPPIMEYIDFIRELRRAVGDGPLIRIGLIGKPRPETVFTPAREEGLSVWISKITAMGDPRTCAERLVNNAA